MDIKDFFKSQEFVDAVSTAYDKYIGEDPVKPPVQPKYTQRKEGYYRGRTNGDRATFYFSIKPSKLPKIFDIVTTTHRFTVDNTTSRQQTGNFLKKESDSSGPGRTKGDLVILLARNYKNRKAWIEY